MVMSRSSFSKLTTTTPPKRGPNYRGLNIKDKTVKTITEKINANRQSFTKRTANYKTT
jgi:hypothetical protein